MKSATLSVSILIAAVLIGGAILFSSKGSSQQDANTSGNNVSIVDGKQIVEITAKGRYQPRTSAAKADIPTILRFNTNGTFDCTSVIRIPSLNITKNLPPTGATDIDLGSPKVGTLQGSCGMGMYPFEIDFNG